MQRLHGCRKALDIDRAKVVVFRYHISGVSREKLPAYLQHRLDLSGPQIELFEAPG
jgi:hypothetical protein